MRKFNYHTRKLRKQRKLFKKLAIIPLNHLFNKKFKSITNILSDQLGQNVQLELIRSHYTYKNSNILANLIGLISYFINFRYISRKLFKAAKITRSYNKIKEINYILFPSVISGINIKLAGRILSKKLKRKVQSKIVQKGSIARNKAKLVTSSRFTNKNKLGAFSITIKTGHIVID